MLDPPITSARLVQHSSKARATGNRPQPDGRDLGATSFPAPSIRCRTTSSSGHPSVEIVSHERGVRLGTHTPQAMEAPWFCLAATSSSRSWY